MRVGLALAFCAVGLGLAALALRKRSEARSEAYDDAAEWHLSAEPGALAYSAIQFFHRSERIPPYTH